jgi:hypothetical protein
MSRWEKGRQDTGYSKLKIFQFLNMDCYLLKYKVGDYIPWHTDPVPGRKHYRLNIELKKAEEGGELRLRRCVNDLFYIKPKYRFALFRSDTMFHTVTKITKGERLVLTFGIAL